MKKNLEKITRVCDYCQSQGATEVNDEGFIFHRECATIYEKENKEGYVISPKIVFHKIQDLINDNQ